MTKWQAMELRERVQRVLPDCSVFILNRGLLGFVVTVEPGMTQTDFLIGITREQHDEMVNRETEP